jgi:hypothetical protein
VAATRPESDAIRRRHVCLLTDRVAATRNQLLELAALVDWTPSLDSECEAELRWLLTSGCDSPLYQEGIHISELHASLYFLRCRLDPSREHADRPAS